MVRSRVKGKDGCTGHLNARLEFFLLLCTTRGKCKDHNKASCWQNIGQNLTNQ